MIILTQVARREIASQLAYIAALDPRAAARLAAEIQRAFDLLASGIADGRSVQLQRSARRVRSWSVLPVVLYYARDGVDVRILRVRHAVQRPIARIE